MILALGGTHAAHAQRPSSYIRGDLLVGQWRSDPDLTRMTTEDQRNTLIVELANRTASAVPFYQRLNDSDLAGAGALLAFLRGTGGRSDADLKRMTADDMRNTVIVMVATQTGRPVPQLQAMTNLQLTQLILGPERAWIRGVLLVGQFRSQLDLDRMSGEDQRNTLIVELANRTANLVPFYQGLSDSDLAGVGALMVYLRRTGSRSDAALKAMRADDIRNTAIVDIHGFTRRADLQTLTNIQLARVILGSFDETRDPASLPEPQRPGPHTLSLRVDRWFANNSVRRFSDVPFFGLFIGRNIDCQHGFNPAGTATGNGAAFTGFAGWGQVDGDGHPNYSKDQCVSWVYRLGFDFDVTPFTSIPVFKTINRVALGYAEQQAPACMTNVYTQGGFFVDALPCWTAGDANLEAKPDGCLTLRIPDFDWVAKPPTNFPASDTGQTFRKIAPRLWDVTTLFENRLSPPLQLPGSPPPRLGLGYMLTGTFTSTDDLEAKDNTRCSSLVSDLRLDVTYIVPPLVPIFDPQPIK